MRKIMYTSVEVQCSVLVVDWQAIAPNGLLAAILTGRIALVLPDGRFRLNPCHTS
jgi:hypothetical protein